MASSSRAGLEKIFRGILSYRRTSKDSFVQQFKQIKASPDVSPSAVFFSCIDARLQPSAFTSTKAGDMFIVRNAGNMVPPASSISGDDPSKVSNEAAALELGCSMLNVKHVVVCGHSDCKAINLLHSMSGNFDQSGCKLAKETDPLQIQSPLRNWMKERGLISLCRYNELAKNSFAEPMMISIDGDTSRKIPAFIDKEGAFEANDKLSQINTLVQMENVASYPFVARCLREEGARLHGLWFDIHSGEVYYFSRKNASFQRITDKNVDDFLDELEDVEER